MYGQKDYLLTLIAHYGRDWRRLEADMAHGLSSGLVRRASNVRNWSDQTYAHAVVNCWRRRGI